MKLDHRTIGELQGGGIGFAIDQALREGLRDCAGRPALDKARTVTIQISLKPLGGSLQDSSGTGLGAVGVKVDIKTSVPNRSGDTDVLSVQNTADSNGEPVINANFMQVPLLGGQEN